MSSIARSIRCNTSWCGGLPTGLYWANIGCLVYGVEEAKLLAETGDHAENPTMSLAVRTVVGSGQK